MKRFAARQAFRRGAVRFGRRPPALPLAALLLAAGLGLGGRSANAGSLDATLEVDNTQPYVREPFRLILRFRSQDMPLGETLEVEGFPPAEELTRGRFQPLPPERRVEDGTVTEVYAFAAECLALVAAPMDLEPVLRVRVIERRPGAGDALAERTVTVRPPPVRLNVRAPPAEGRPAFDSGSVGTFTMDVEIEPARPAVGDPVLVTMRVQGDGYLRAAHPPLLDPAPHCTVYPPRRKETRGASGLVFEQWLVPLSPHATQVPAVRYAYFHPREQRYVTLRHDPIPLHLRPAAEAGTLQPVAPGLADRLLGRRRMAAAGSILARFAPNPAARITFRIPDGTRTTVLERHRGWIKIRCAAGIGWVCGRTPAGAGAGPGDDLSADLESRSVFAYAAPSE